MEYQLPVMATCVYLMFQVRLCEEYYSKLQWEQQMNVVEWSRQHKQTNEQLECI